MYNADEMKINSQFSQEGVRKGLSKFLEGYTRGGEKQKKNRGELIDEFLTGISKRALWNGIFELPRPSCATRSSWRGT